MHLLLRRSQRDDGWIWSSMMFLLDARLELAAEEQHLAEKYDLLSLVVYDSDARTDHADAAYEHFDNATKVPLLEPSLSELAASLWANVCGTAHGVMMALSLRITVADLIAGQHVEGEDLDAILNVEQVIAKAAELIAAYLETALTFDGREQLLEY